MRALRGSCVVLVALGACGGAASHVGAVSSATPGPGNLRGVWASEGYGYQFEVGADGELARSQVTSVSCIPTWRARVVARDQGSVTYRRLDGPYSYVVRADGASGRISIHQAETSSAIFAHRLAAPTPICEHPTPDTPRSNLETFAATFAEQYPFFAQHGVDWDAAVASARSRVTDATKPSELFEIMKGMLEPLHDAHTSIEAHGLDGADEGRGYAGFRFAPGAVDPDEYPRVHALVEPHLVRPLATYCEGKIAFGMLPASVGYLRIDAFAGYAKDPSFEAGAAELEHALDAIFADASGWRGLVVDVRTNDGGADPYGLSVAARLTATEYTAYAKQARLDPRDPTRWTSAVPSVVRPSARPGFHGPIVMLTGPDTVSAGETFTMALLERRPPVERVGQSTQGVFSDVMARRLPNGWIVGVPCERYLTRGRSYDVTGIPPTIEVPLYAPADVAAGRDTALERAMQLLGAAGAAG